MGYQRQKVFVVTAHGYNDATKALKQVRSFIMRQFKGLDEPGFTSFKTVTPIMYGMNSVCSFAILPDGSKEGWDESDRVDEVIEKAIRKIKKYRYEDNSSPLSYGYMCFDDEENETWMRTG